MSSEPAVLCFDIGGTFMRFGVSERPGHLVQLEQFATPKDSLDALSDAISRLIARRAGDVALSVAGLVDPLTGVVTSANIPAISGVALGQVLAARLNRRVTVANDADCLTLAEAHEGAGRGHGVVFCVILGTGVGGGLAVDGRIVSGAGEWGHGPVVNERIDLNDGEPLILPRMACGCGQKGCVDTVGAARGIERLHHALHGQAAGSQDIIGGWQSGDAAAARTVAAYVELVADPLAVVVNVTGASAVPVGGGMAGATELIALLDVAVRKRVLKTFGAPLVVPAHWREDGGLMGAAIRLRQERL